MLDVVTSRYATHTYIKRIWSHCTPPLPLLVITLAPSHNTFEFIALCSSCTAPRPVSDALRPFCFVPKSTISTEAQKVLQQRRVFPQGSRRDEPPSVVAKNQAAYDAVTAPVSEAAVKSHLQVSELLLPPAMVLLAVIHPVPSPHVFTLNSPSAAATASQSLWQAPCQSRHSNTSAQPPSVGISSDRTTR
jgi:hypothetical protein